VVKGLALRDMLLKRAELKLHVYSSEELMDQFNYLALLVEGYKILSSGEKLVCKSVAPVKDFTGSTSGKDMAVFEQRFNDF
jgi:hypothetical protein